RHSEEPAGHGALPGVEVSDRFHGNTLPGGYDI
ncbi:hypothetical protein ABH924_002929, partial [Arthrobacter sp. GAS37]